ncbi:MAG: hypothetical protein M1399_01100 [Actinobacteria bacterium]|nr:hypothetical protein [Actinomycetota bacterium]
MANTMDSEGMEEASPEPAGTATITYTGHLAPYWDIQLEGKEQGVLESFRDRAMARLTMLPPYDPQFRRNGERVSKEAERQGIVLHWNLGTERDWVFSGKARPDGDA